MVSSLGRRPPRAGNASVPLIKRRWQAALSCFALFMGTREDRRRGKGVSEQEEEEEEEMIKLEVEKDGKVKRSRREREENSRS